MTSIQLPRIPMRAASPFVDIAAVEAWDAWFRWRAGDRLRDISIDDTWTRVAHALGAAEASAGSLGFEQRLIQAGINQQVLLDERILATAGTDTPDWSAGDLSAVINAAAFVHARFSPRARFDHAAFADAAALAVRALDNAIAVAPRKEGSAHAGIRVGIVGLADAIAFLRVPYDSAHGRSYARSIAQSLYGGCMAKSARLARERGARSSLAARNIADGVLNVLPNEIRSDLERYGLRHVLTTAIDPQPRLALLANNVADALDPLRGADHTCVIATSDASRSVVSSGYAMTLYAELQATQPMPMPAFDTIADVSTAAQIALRGAVQPWIDAPISYPLTVMRLPDPRSQQRDGLLAAAHGLVAPTWAISDGAAASGVRAAARTTPATVQAR